MLLLLHLEGEPPWFRSLFRKLLVADVSAQLPGTSAELAAISDAEARKLIGYASVLALSSEHAHQALAYEIATRLIELFESQIPALVSAADVILSRLGNFPGRRLLRKRCAGGEHAVPQVPARLGLERLGRELENTVIGPDARSWTLTDFQHEFLSILDGTSSVSVSAPTSAGKTFVLTLDLVRRLRKVKPACVVYVVPTRALIREVAFKIRDNLRKAELQTVPVRTVPFPIARDKAPQGAVFVLTQERLLSLLYSHEGPQWITTIFVDEAQSIQDDARGVILQTAVESVLLKNPKAEVHLASPLTSNPDFFLRLFQRGGDGKHLIRTLSPVSHNVILVSEVSRKKTQATFRLLGDDETLEIGVRELGFELRGSTYKQRAALARAVTEDDESTLIYANNPADTEALAMELIADLPVPVTSDPDIDELVEYIRADVHEEYRLVECLPYGVAFHYGYMPALVRARVEDLCRDGKVKFVCCTSTLLQGVNLPARHIVIDNPKRGNKEGMTRADFLNLSGRAGRLLREFHGNVWCIRPDEWEEKSYHGESLSEIRSAIDGVMADGGTLVQRTLRNEASEEERDLGEAALGKLYCDFVRQGQDLAESPWKTAANAETLASTAAHLSALRVTLPTEILDANRAVRPDRMQALYERLRRVPDPAALVPLRPGAEGANDRMGSIIQIVQETLGGIENDSYKFYKWLAIQWIYNKPLKQIIALRLEGAVRRGTSQSLSTSIRELLRTLESAIRYRLVKYFMAYNSVIALVLRERGEAIAADELEPFHVYLECGASDRVALNLMALGLSRATALALRDKISIPGDASPEDCLSKLAVMDLAALEIPKLCLREVRDLLGRSIVGRDRYVSDAKPG